MPRPLKDIDVDEISLVDAGAVRKKFYIKKRRSLMDLIELLKDFLGEDTELTDEEIEKAGKLSEEAAKAISSAVSALNKFKDDFPPEILSALKTLTKFASYGYPAKKAEEVDFLKEMVDLEKAGARLSKATIEDLKKVAAIVEKLIGASEDKVKKAAGDKVDIDKLPDTVVARLEKLDRIEAEAVEKKQKEKDKEFTDMKKDVDMLKKIAKGEPVSKQLDEEEEDDDKDKDKDKKKDKTTFTKAEIAKMDLAEKRKYADQGLIDLWPSIEFGVDERRTN